MIIGKISFEKSVGCVIFREENGKYFLLLLHYLLGHWDFPKGHVESGETELDTLSREVEEETGLNDLKIVKGFRKSIFYSYKPRGAEKKEKEGVKIVIKKVVYYLGKTSGDDIFLSDEHLGYEWIESTHALKKITHDQGRRIFLRANDFLRKNGFE